MNRKDATQLELDFSVIKFGTKVKVTGYDTYNYLDMTNSIGVVDFYLQKTGDYKVTFKRLSGIVPGTRLFLYFRREQLEVIPNRRQKYDY